MPLRIYTSYASNYIFYLYYMGNTVGMLESVGLIGAFILAGLLGITIIMMIFKGLFNGAKYGLGGILGKQLGGSSYLEMAPIGGRKRGNRRKH